MQFVHTKLPSLKVVPILCSYSTSVTVNSYPCCLNEYQLCLFQWFVYILCLRIKSMCVRIFYIFLIPIHSCFRVQSKNKKIILCLLSFIWKYSSNLLMYYSSFNSSIHIRFILYLFLVSSSNFHFTLSIHISFIHFLSKLFSSTFYSSFH